MAKYLLIESRDPFDAAEVGNHYEVAETLKKAGNEVTLFLVENGVLPARKSPASERLTALSKAGVTVLADAFSLKERGIGDGSVAEGIGTSPLETVIDQLEAGAKAVWH
ncbi:MAG: DsrE family protein [Myxococcales bacterium]|nr:DsrE family protein [Myxococcales bacterium]